MLKETKTEEAIGFFAPVLSWITFQLRRDLRVSWLRLWPGVPGPLNLNSMTCSKVFPQLIFFKSALSRKNTKVEVNYY